jgi:hypothetical protein
MTLPIGRENIFHWAPELLKWGNAASVNLMQTFCSSQLLELHYKLYWIW